MSRRLWWPKKRAWMVSLKGYSPHWEEAEGDILTDLEQRVAKRGWAVGLFGYALDLVTATCHGIAESPPSSLPLWLRPWRRSLSYPLLLALIWAYVLSPRSFQGVLVVV